MEYTQVFCVVLLAIGCQGMSLTDTLDFGPKEMISNETAAAYNHGVDMGIIDPKKYSLESFAHDETHVFKDTYNEYMSMNGSYPLDYQEWLIMNNYGILPDTNESMFQRKISKRSTADNKRAFVNTVKKGDILISGRGTGGLLGHAAIMTSDYWVLEMPGGDGFMSGIRDNNRQIPKDKWFDEHASDWTTVYRCPDNSVARQAAGWADRNYYNPNGGATKTIHVTYKITADFTSKNPSYCSKLVVQAYYYGTGSKSVIYIRDKSNAIIIPTTIPSYFRSPYLLVNKGKY
ncbi:hypothetical protein HW555_007004 [Spodoptera exigua]|uniref:Uncharacterized protein n=1 Tax=Spodoptera exigua TaxID=7107 RepID=A0A835L5T8_SPOEX|nr:hypothetical protein HW555_007004 [Spodoptera exigua]